MPRFVPPNSSKQVQEYVIWILFVTYFAELSLDHYIRLDFFWQYLNMFG